MWRWGLVAESCVYEVPATTKLSSALSASRRFCWVRDLCVLAATNSMSVMAGKGARARKSAKLKHRSTHRWEMSRSIGRSKHKQASRIDGFGDASRGIVSRGRSYSISFSAKDDRGGGTAYRVRTGLPLASFQRRYDTLKDVGPVPSGAGN